MSFLLAVSLTFSVCSRYSLPLTPGRQQESKRETGIEGKQRLGEQQEWHRTTERYRSLPCLSACQCPSRHLKHTTDTPSSFTLDCYHGNSLFFFPAQSLRGGLSQPIIKQPLSQNNTHMHVHIIETMLLCKYSHFLQFWKDNSNTFVIICDE